MHDTTFHIVECRFGKVRYFREMDLADADQETLVRDLLSGQFDDPRRIIAFNTAEGWSRDVSEDIARLVMERAARDADALTAGVRDFCERYDAAPPWRVGAEQA